MAHVHIPDRASQTMYETPTHAHTHTDTDLYVPIEADSGYKNPVQALEGGGSVLLLVDVKSQSVLGQVQQDAHGRALGDASLRPARTHTHTHATMTRKKIK